MVSQAGSQAVSLPGDSAASEADSTTSWEGSSLSGFPGRQSGSR